MRASTMTRYAIASFVFVTIDSYAGTTPFRRVGNATCFTRWMSLSPPTARLIQPRAAFASFTLMSEWRAPVLAADLTHASAAESLARPVRAVSRVSADETWPILHPFLAVPVSPTVTEPPSAASKPSNT